MFPTLTPYGTDEDYFLWAVVEEWIHTAEMLNFTGIGLYPQWKLNGKQRPGLHLDVREGKLSKWGYVDGEFVSIEKAIETL